MTSNIPKDQPKIFDRSTVIRLLQIANQVQSFRFVKNLVQEWLNNFPGDLAIEYSLAESFVKQNRHEEALPILKRIMVSDPEYLPALRLAAYSGSAFPYGTVDTALESIYALGGRTEPVDNTALWGTFLRQAVEQYKAGKNQDAEALFQKALGENPNSPLPAVLHLKFACDHYPWESLKDLASSYHTRWPDTLTCILIYADTLIKVGQEEEAVNLLHQASALDIGGQVAIRLWGTQHPYQNLVPNNPQLVLDTPVPSEVAAAVGWNQLPQGKMAKKAPAQSANGTPDRTSHYKRLSKEVIESAKEEFTQIAAKIKRPKIASADARYPVYLIVSSKQGLENQYRVENLQVVDEALELLAQKTKQIKGWNSYVVYVDDSMDADKFGLPPALPKDPWSIKKFIADMDQALAKNGERIGALLIAGGDQVVPFHLLPNPIDDFDTQVPSDNPYASKDENYFVPTWPVGRVPGSAEGDPLELVKQIQHIAASRDNLIQNSEQKSIFSLIFGFLARFLFKKGDDSSFGYSAEVWRRAANAVFRPIGKPHQLTISPPAQSGNLPAAKKSSPRLAYFNLHGLENTAEWYGQRDPLEAQSGPDYPVALRTTNIKNSGSAPVIVFSEACFGANIVNKKVEEAICLKFLDSGSLAVVGSTCTSYGSISTPLIAADLLGKMFWINLKDGYPAGESLRRAKIHLAKEMNRVQGYLDGEDQKTLVSFVLYGDPLAQISKDSNMANAKGYQRDYANPNKIKTVCDKLSDSNQDPIPDEVIAQVKSVVKQYLPGMENARISYSQEHLNCVGHDCPTKHLGENSLPKHIPSRRVVTLSKQFVNNKNTHAYHARITINEEGKVSKLVVSR